MKIHHLLKTPHRGYFQKANFTTYNARPATIRPKRPAPAMATRVSGATLLVADVVLPEPVADPVSLPVLLALV